MKSVLKINKFNEKFMKNYDENSDIRYILEEDIQYAKKLFFPFFFLFII